MIKWEVHNQGKMLWSKWHTAGRADGLQPPRKCASKYESNSRRPSWIAGLNSNTREYWKWLWSWIRHKRKRYTKEIRTMQLPIPKKLRPKWPEYIETERWLFWGVLVFYEFYCVQSSKYDTFIEIWSEMWEISHHFQKFLLFRAFVGLGNFSLRTIDMVIKISALNKKRNNTCL